MSAGSVQVVGFEGKPVEVSPGETWPLPYRGARYSIRQVDQHLKVVWQWQDIVVPSVNYPNETLRAMRSVGKPRGSFCVTSHGLLLTKIPSDNGKKWRPVYVGRFHNDIDFGDLSRSHAHLKMGMYWTGFPFRSGETWFVSPRPGAKEIPMWKYQGIGFGATRRYPQMYRLYLSVRSVGGRFYITEQGQVWMNLRDDQISDGYKDDFIRMQKDQVDQLVADNKGATLQLLKLRMQATACRPVYLGDVKDLDYGEAPWTFFKNSPATEFGKGSETTVDDEDKGGDWEW
jgi:hypothetical protein